MKNLTFTVKIIITFFLLIFYSCDATKVANVEVNVCDGNNIIPSDLNYNDIARLKFVEDFTYLVGDSGLICSYYTPDLCGLDTFPKKTNLNLNAIDGYYENENVIVGDSGFILVALDTIINTGEVQNFNDVVSVWDVYSYIIAGDSGKIYRSSDDGYTWYSVNSGTNLNILSLELGSMQNSVYATGEDGIYLRSSDDGESWEVQNISGGGFAGINPDIYSIKFIDENHGWASGENGKIFKTTNGGTSWISQNTGLSVNINNLIFNSYSYGYAVADNGKVIYTTDGGTSWLLHPLFDTLTTKNIKKIIKSDSMNYFAAGDSALIVNINTGIAASPLSGIVTAGDTGDFFSVNNALLAAAALGIKDSVKIEILPGTYNEQLFINQQFPETAKLTLAGLNDSVSVLKDVSDTANYVLKFSYAKNILVEDLNLSSPDTNKGTIVYFEGECSDITFRNVTFNGISAVTSTIDQSIIRNDLQSGTTLKNIRFYNCTFNNGSFGIRLIGYSSLNLITGLEVVNCTFNKCTQTALSLNFNEGFLISGNRTDSTALGISLGNSKNFNVSGNQINTLNISMSLNNCTASGSSRNLISNNFFHSNTIAFYLAVSNSRNDIYFNSFNIQNPYDTANPAGTSCLSTFFFSGSDNNILNNLFVNNRKGFAISFSYSGMNPLTSLNYNNYYTKGSNIAVWQGISYQDFSSFKTASGRDTNSSSSEVFYIGPEDLHLRGSSDGDITLAGKFLSEVDTDIDGSTRSMTLPYKGADEGIISLEFKTLQLKLNYEALTVADTVIVQIRNNVSPFNIIESKTGMGVPGMFSNFYFQNAVNGNPYYLAVRHRNSIETWSGNAVSFSGDSLEYDFTSDISQAFGNNMTQVSGLWSIYSGDVNQDGTVDASDLSGVENDAITGLSGYVLTDLTGDDFVDASDLSVVENNAAVGISAVTP